MSLYSDCLQFADNLLEKSEEVNVSLVPRCRTDALIPFFLKEDLEEYEKNDTYNFEDYNRKYRDVYYISNIHLDEHIVKMFNFNSNDKEVETYIKKVVEGLFSERLQKEIKREICGNTMRGNLDFRKFAILFGGDIATSFEVSRNFFFFIANL